MEKIISHKLLFTFVTILITLSVLVKGNENFMKKILNKCSRKLRLFEQASGSSDVMDMKTKLLAKAVPPTKLEGNIFLTW